jgi:hypothetical protein
MSLSDMPVAYAVLGDSSGSLFVIANDKRHAEATTAESAELSCHRKLLSFGYHPAPSTDSRYIVANMAVYELFCCILSSFHKAQ